MKSAGRWPSSRHSVISFLPSPLPFPLPFLMASLTFSSLNVNGLRKPNKGFSLNRFLSSSNVHVVGLQETHWATEVEAGSGVSIFPLTTFTGVWALLNRMDCLSWSTDLCGRWFDAPLTTTTVVFSHCLFLSATSSILSPVSTVLIPAWTESVSFAACWNPR